MTTELTTEQEAHIAKSFEVQEVEINGYTNAYNHILSLEITPEISKQARALRLDLAKERTSVNKTHRLQKAYFLNGGRFVDSLKNVLIDKLKNMESKLKEIEDYEEIRLAEKVAKLQAERALEFSKYSENIPDNLGKMEAELYEATLLGIKALFEKKQADSKEAERKEKEEQRRIALSNERRNKILSFWDFVENVYDLNFGTMESEEFESILKNAKNAKAKYEAEQEKIRLENEKLKREQKEAEQKMAEEKAKQNELQAKLKAQELEMLAKEKAKKLAEEKARKEAKKLANAPIKEQLNAWVSSFEISDISLQHKVKSDIQLKFNGFVNWAKKEVDKI